jgi:hypothetical protein
MNKQTSILYATETITPEVAKRYLSRNTANRPLCKIRVEFYANQIKNGTWDGLNGDTIVFDENGMLTDGQHRLHAVIKSGIPLTTIVVRGTSCNSFVTLDQGTKRSGSNILSIAGFKYAPTIASALRYMHAYELRLRNPAYGVNKFPTNIILEILKKNLDIADSAAFVFSNMREPHGWPDITAGVLCALHCLCSRADKTMADDLLTRFALGKCLDPEDPTTSGFYALYQKVQKEKRGGGALRRINNGPLFWLGVKAWNMSVAGTVVSRLSIKDTEDLPCIAGI